MCICFSINIIIFIYCNVGYIFLFYMYGVLSIKGKASIIRNCSVFLVIKMSVFSIKWMNPCTDFCISFCSLMSLLFEVHKWFDFSCLWRLNIALEGGLWKGFFLCVCESIERILTVCFELCAMASLVSSERTWQLLESHTFPVCFWRKKKRMRSKSCWKIWWKLNMIVK